MKEGRKKLLSILANNITLVKNFSYLSVLQVLNILLPLIAYPYLIRVLGKDVWGLVVFAQAIAAYLVILVSFGFNVSATRFVSIYRNDSKKIDEVFSSVTIIKTTLFLLSLIIMILLILFLNQAKNQKLLFILSLWTCINELLFPVWYFQGIEKMRYITYVSVISKLISIVLIFLFIKHPGDYVLVPLFFLVGTIISGILSLKIILVNDRVKFSWQNYNTLKYYFTDSLTIFISIVAMSVFVNSNKVLIGFFMSMKEVAHYDLAEKIITFFKTPQTILSQTVFPKISKEKNTGFIKKILSGAFLFNFFLAAFLFVTTKYFVLFLGGTEMLPTVYIINILVVTIVLSSISNILGLQVLIPFGYKNEFTYTFVFSSFLYILFITATYLFSKINITNISVAVVLTEFSIVLFAYYYCRKNKILLTA
ncbi:MAG: oligosaccharide flippase family protein [Lacibacter sp.]